MDSAGQDKQSNKPGSPGDPKSSKDAGTPKDKSPSHSQPGKRPPSTDSVPGSSQRIGSSKSAEETATGSTPNKERRHSKSSAEVPEHLKTAEESSTGPTSKKKRHHSKSSVEVPEHLKTDEESSTGTMSKKKRRHSKSSVEAPEHPKTSEEASAGSVPHTKRHHSKSAVDVPELKESRADEKGATESGHRKSSLRATGHPAASKQTTSKDAAPSKEAAVRFSSEMPAAETLAVDYLRPLVFPTAVVVVFVLVMGFTFFVGNYIPVPPVPAAATQSSCPEESQIVLRALNDSVKPCHNFYAHVCSKLVADRKEPFSRLMKRAVSSAFVRFANLGVRANAAGMLRASLHSHSGGEVADYIKSISRVTGINASSPMTISGTVRFFAQMSLRYKLPGVVSFKVSQSGSLLRVERNDGCLRDLGHNASLKTSDLRAISETLNTSLSLHDLERVEAELANLRVADDSFSQPINVTTSPFSVLSEPEWKEILKSFVEPAYPNVTELTQKAGDRLNEVISAFSDVSRHPALLAYAVVCTAMQTRASVALAVACPSPSLECGACHALDVCEIEDAQFGAVTSSPCTNERIRGLFARIRSSVIARAKSHVLLKGASEKTIAGKVENVSLALPLEMGASLVAAPHVSRSFADNLLAARSYGFDIRQIKVTHDLPSRESRFSPSAVRRGRVVYVTNHMYSLMGHNCPHKGAEFPVVGVELAFHLWSFLFEHFWPTEEEWNAEPKLSCLRGMYGQNSDDAGFRKKLALTLALAGISDAELAGKGQLKLDVKGTHVPLARYAFIVWLHERCAVMPGWLSPEEVNSMLNNDPGFASAFTCPKPKTC